MLFGKWSVSIVRTIRDTNYVGKKSRIWYIYLPPGFKWLRKRREQEVAYLLTALVHVVLTQRWLMFGGITRISVYGVWWKLSRVVWAKCINLSRCGVVSILPSTCLSLFTKTAPAKTPTGYSNVYRLWRHATGWLWQVNFVGDVEAAAVDLI